MAGTEIDLNWSEDFSYGFLAELYQRLMASYPPLLIGDAASAVGSTALLVRHDLDLSVRRAVTLARLEADLGLRSTYHVMVDCPFYDVESPAVQEDLRAISELGHEIGLHYDPDNSRTAEVPLEEDLAHSCERVATAVGMPVRSLSFHRPPPALLGGGLFVAGRVNAYAEPFFEWYLSDSRGRWREGNPMESIERPRSTLLQMLVHPIWWGPERISPGQRLGGFIAELAEERSAPLPELSEQVLAHIAFPRDQLILAG